MRQSRTIIIEPRGQEQDPTFIDEETQLPIKCAYREGNCSPLCAASSLFGSADHIMCNLNGGENGFQVGFLNREES